MISILNIFYLIFTVRALFKIAFILSMLRFVKYKKSRNCIKNTVVVVKVFEEASSIAECVQYWTRIMENYSNLELFIVGSDRENVNGTNPTLSIAQAVSCNHDRIVILEAKNGDGINASSQVNFAVANISRNPDDTWILLADVDSRYDSHLLEEASYLANKKDIVVQINSDFLKNYDDLDWFQKGHSFLQTRWTFAHEKIRTKLYCITNLVLTHVVGHGMYINLYKFRELKGYSLFGYAEDIELGYRMCVLNIKIVNPTQISSSDSPRLLSEGIRQEISWSYGPMLYPNYFFKFWPQLNTNILKLRAVIFCLQGVFLYINWLISSWVIFFALVLTLYGYMYPLLFISFYTIEHLISLFIVIKLRGISAKSAFIGFLSLIIARLRHSLPANFGLIRFIFTKKLFRSQTPH